MIKKSYMLWAFLLGISYTEINHGTSPKKHKVEHPCPNKTLATMTEEELLLMVDYAEASADQDFIFKVYRYLFSNMKDQNNFKMYKLRLADYCFEQKLYEKAAFAYEEFFVLYPGSEEFEYTQYKAIACWFFLSLDAHRDQHNTDKTIYLIDLYLAKAKNQDYITECIDIRKKCRHRLFEYELNVWAHYLKMKKFSSVDKRYEYIETHFQDIEDLEAYLTYCKKMRALVENPKTCPFWIKINFEDALIAEKTVPSESVASEERKEKKAAYYL